MGSKGPKGAEGLRGDRGPEGPTGLSAAPCADEPIEPTFDAPPVPLTSAECTLSRPGSELAAGMYRVVSAVQNAYRAFSSAGASVAATESVELVLPCAMTIRRVAVPGTAQTSIELTCLVGTTWTTCAANEAVNLVATRVQILAKESVTLANVKITASGAEPHTLLRLVALDGTKATVLSSCAVRTAGSISAGSGTVTGTVGATPRTLVFDGTGISTESVRSATVSGLVAEYPWPGSTMNAQPVYSATTVAATILSPTGAATTTLVAATRYTGVTLTVQGATVSTVESVEFSVGAQSQTCTVASFAGGVITLEPFTTGTALGALTFTVLLNGTTTVSTIATGISVVEVPVVTAGCALLAGLAVGVPLVAPSGAWVVEAYVNGARVTVTDATVALTASAQGSAPVLEALVAPAYVKVQVTLEVGALPTSVSITRSVPVVTAGKKVVATIVPAPVTVARGAVFDLTVPSAPTARKSSLSFDVTPGTVAEYTGTVTVSLGNQSVVPRTATYAVTVLRASDIYAFPTSVAATIDYVPSDDAADKSLGSVVAGQAYGVKVAFGTALSPGSITAVRVAGSTALVAAQ
ncbi:MAG: hypothetical protein EBZ77_04910, partial [Chitinophagia bacterium]|nr:hypothetical protein [Chitinophagia bacterium]